MFSETLAFGKLGESQIASWLRSRGNYVLPVYEKVADDKQGPRLFGPSGTHIAPDMLCWGAGGVCWIEAKHKDVFTWHRNTSTWTTGIDRRHYRAYLTLAREWPAFPMWLLFLHSSAIPDAKDTKFCPLECPVGLYGGRLLELAKQIHHEHDNWGPSGMVYWAEADLTKLATLEEVNMAEEAMLVGTLA